MKRSIDLAFAIAMLAGHVVVSGDTDIRDPVEILKRADAATRAVKVVRYSATRTPGGSVSETRAHVRGKVVMAGWKTGALEKFRIDATAKKTVSGQPMDVTTMSDGEDFGLVDHLSKKAYVDIDPAVIGISGRTARVLELPEFVHPTPFSDEINGRQHEIVGTRSIGGVDCYEIHVTYAVAAQDAYWFFSKKDFLPRGVRRIFPTSDGGTGSIELLLTELEVNTKPDAKGFEFSLPQGYARIDDFAP